MIDSKHLNNAAFLIDLAGQLQDTWELGNEDQYPPELRAQMALLEDMAEVYKCIFSLFDFEKHKYIFHTKNLFNFVGLERDQRPSKWDSSYLSLIEDRNPIEIYLALREKLLVELTLEQREHFQSTFIIKWETPIFVPNSRII